MERIQRLLLVHGRRVCFSWQRFILSSTGRVGAAHDIEQLGWGSRWGSGWCLPCRGQFSCLDSVGSFHVVWLPSWPKSDKEGKENSALLVMVEYTAVWDTEFSVASTGFQPVPRINEAENLQ